MEWRGYQLSSYTSKDIEGILQVLSYIWIDDKETIKKNFIRKFQNNPFTKKRISIVAKHQGKVIGFQGFLPAEWEIDGKRFMILNSCDSVVHPEHRRKGLYLGMFKLMMREYCREYNFMVAFTSNNLSTPAAFKVGWKPLFPRKYLRHLSMLNLAGAGILGSNRTMVNYGNFGDIEVSNTLRSADVSRIGGSYSYAKKKFSINKTPNFLEWKLLNSKTKYVYFYHHGEFKIDAYVILTVQNHAHVIDYGEEDGSNGIKKLFSFILSHSRFGSISFLTASIHEDFEVLLRSKHFYALDWIEKRIRKESYNLPILIRPTVENHLESDWFVNDVDLRDVNNWHITEICFD